MQLRTQHSSDLRTWTGRLAVFLSSLLLVPLTGVGTAHAAGSWAGNLAVSRNGGATFTISDSINPGAFYAITLTAAGGGTCSLTSGTTEIADYGLATGYGLISTATQGSCNLYDAAVTYILTWTPVGGAPGQLAVECYWLLGNPSLGGYPSCTPKSFRGDAVSGLITQIPQ